MIIFAGDQHEDAKFAQKVADLAQALNAQAVVYAGDGGLWPDLTWVNSAAASCPVYLVRGNHEHQEFCREFALGTVTELVPGVFFAQDGSTLPGFPIGVLGGAASIDAASRTEGVDVWVNWELPTLEAVSLLPNSLEILVTHDAPRLPPTLNCKGSDPRAIESRNRVYAAVRQSNPKVVVHGHYHEAYVSRQGGFEVRGLGANFTSFTSSVTVWDNVLGWMSPSEALYA